jgi:hypothetical protein
MRSEQPDLRCARRIMIHLPVIRLTHQQSAVLVRCAAMSEWAFQPGNVG